MLLEHWEQASTSSRLVYAALFLATPALLNRAAEAIAKAQNGAEMLKYLTMHFGIKHRGHPGLTRPEQIIGLEPYLDLLEKHDLEQLAGGCNSAGWFDLRRRLFDPRLPDSSDCWTEQRLPGLFDRLAADCRFSSLDIEHVLETGVKWEAVAAQLRSWLAARLDEDALRLVASILEENGRRVDLDMLKGWSGEETDASRTIVANAQFIVRRRTAD